MSVNLRPFSIYDIKILSDLAVFKNGQIHDELKYVKLKLKSKFVNSNNP